MLQDLCNRDLRRFDDLAKSVGYIEQEMPSQERAAPGETGASSKRR